MKLSNIRFPVFVLANRKIVKENNLILLITEKEEKIVLDNKNIPGNSLQERRLKLSTAKQSKKYFKKVLQTPQDLIKLGKHKKLLDSNGVFFKYEPTIFVPLKFYEAKYYLVNGKRFLYIEKLNFYTKISANINQKYAGILHTSMGYIYYCAVNIKLKDTRRKI